MFEAYKRVYGHFGNIGEALKSQSDMIMNATFDRDVNYKRCFINGEEIEAKFIKIFDYTINADQIEYYLQFRPTIHIEDDYNGEFGQYVDIPDDRNKLERWMIVGKNDANQFVKYNVLKCNWTLRWVYEGKIYEQLGVKRTRNSYNSGFLIEHRSPLHSETLQCIPLNCWEILRAFLPQHKNERSLSVTV